MIDDIEADIAELGLLEDDEILLDEALGEIAARGGTQFDPTIVAAFMRVADAIASLHDDDETGELLPPELD